MRVRSPSAKSRKTLLKKKLHGLRVCFLEADAKADKEKKTKEAARMATEKEAKRKASNVTRLRWRALLATISEAMLVY